MFCIQCGKELPDNSKFCCHCGASIEVSPNNNEENSLEKDKGNRRRIKHWPGIIFAVICFACVVVASIIFLKKEETTETLAEVEDAVRAREELDLQTQGKLENSEDMKTLEEAEGEEIEDYELFVCTPADYMSLRTTPGLGDDVIAELKAGTYLKWYGETAIDNDLEFYKVIVKETGQEGYVAENFCIHVDYDYVEENLDVVETDSALYTYDMMVEDLETLCQNYPDRLSCELIGVSVDGRDIYEVVLGNLDAENHIMMQAGIHGREYITSQLLMKMLEYYAFYYEDGEYENISYKDLFQKTALHVVPMSNPDGISISQSGVSALNDDSIAELLYECYERDKYTLVYEEDTNGDMNWAEYYKDPSFDRALKGYPDEITFDEYLTIWKANAHGVDLNTNFDAGWEELDLKQYPAYGSFKGYAPISEPESVALAELALKVDYECYISYHSRGQLIYYDVKGNSPENSAASENFARLMEEGIKYKPVSTSAGYNVNLGGFGDWIQLILNKPSITIESGKRPCPITIEEFPAIWHRHRESWAMLAYQFY